MYEFTLKKREDDTIRFNIGEKSYLVPLAMGLTPTEAAKIDSLDGAVEFFNGYIDKAVVEKLTLRDYRDMLNIWREASKKSAEMGDVSLGES